MSKEITRMRMATLTIDRNRPISEAEFRAMKRGEYFAWAGPSGGFVVYKLESHGEKGFKAHDTGYGAGPGEAVKYYGPGTVPIHRFYSDAFLSGKKLFRVKDIAQENMPC